jgi:hypothetical protein
VTNCPSGTVAATVVLHSASPEPFVVAVVDPRYSPPSPLPEESHAEVEYRSIE